MNAPQILPLLLVILLILCVAWMVLAAVDCDRWRSRHRIKLRYVFGGGAAIAVAATPIITPQPVVSVPLTDLVSPVLAVGVLRRISSTRRRQEAELRDRRPVRLQQDHLLILGALVEAAGTVEEWVCIPGDEPHGALPADVRELLAAVETLEDIPALGASPEPEWILLVRLLGEPVVQNRYGDRGQFGKKKAMELLAWMVLNRERSTRTAARNAMWDVNVADSTFTTIISDLRRALQRIAPAEGPDGWSPATFSDALPLANGVTSDIEILEHALKCGDIQAKVEALTLVRDVPFAGTGYLWADLDGSTTRAIITVMSVVDSVLAEATESQDVESALLAIRAGLKVLPGDEVLLEYQQSLVRSVR